MRNRYGIQKRHADAEAMHDGDEDDQDVAAAIRNCDQDFLEPIEDA